MSKGRVKITDLAKELGVSPSTISRALSNGERISQKTKDAVASLAKKWGYKPNPYAVNLTKKKSKKIGLILPEFTHHYFSKVLSGIDKVIAKRGYHLLISTHNGDLEKEIQAAHSLAAMHIDGLLVSYARETENYDHYTELLDDGIPIVFLDRSCEDFDASYVVTDDFPGSIEAIEHLFRTGCRKIAHLRGPEDLSTSFIRMMGYKEGLKKCKLEFDENLIVPWTTDRDLWNESVRNLMEIEKIDGLFAFSDYLAFDAIEISKALCLKIPEEISVIGFADEPVASFMCPKLTTIHQPAEKMGKVAAKILLWHLEDKNNFDIKTERLKTRLVIRETTRKL